MKPLDNARKFTPDAIAAFGSDQLSRRDFLKRSGMMIIGFSMAGSASSQTVRLDGAGSNQLDSWIAISSDGAVTAYTGKCELGQGLYTAQTQLIAEELNVAFSRVKLIQCDTLLTPDQGTTSGAQSHPTNFNQNNLALAAATAREELLRRASMRLGVPVTQLVVNDGVISAKADAIKSIRYAQLIGGQKFTIALNPKAKRKRPNEWDILGQPTPRVELPAMVTGQFEYVHNVRVPGMLHGRVVRPPAIGATLIDIDENSIQGLPGVVRVVVKKNFVGVVAEKPWQAVQAATKLKVNWTQGTGLPRQQTFHDDMRSRRLVRDTFFVNTKDVDAKLAGGNVVKATYLHPYQMHASIGTACAVADVQGSKATIWSATQAVYPLRSSMAMVLGMPAESVRVVFRMGAGCYGVNGADTASYDAAILSQAVGKPVRVQLMRKDEMAWENYGLPFVIDERAAVDSNGNIIAWDHESWSAVLGGRPGPTNPGNIVTGFLLGFEPASFAARSPAPDPSAYANNNNPVPSYVTGSVNGKDDGTGAVASQRVLTHNVQSPFFTGPLRSPERLQNTFAHESFIDEIAAHVKADPVEYRLRHLRDPRLIDVVNGAAKAAAWQTRPSPQGSIRNNSGTASGRGISCVLYEGDNGYCAIVAEVDVNQETGAIAVKRLVVANDCGPISNPDGLRNQLEGGALHGMSRALLEEVTWDETTVTSVDWRTYRSLYLGADIPKIETVLINRPEATATGAGETSVTVVAAAIANAVFDATGARIRQIPFTPDRVKAALAARGSV